MELYQHTSVNPQLMLINLFSTREDKGFHKVRLSKQQAINKAYSMLLKGCGLEEIEHATGWNKRTITKWLDINWNTLDARPEYLYLKEEIWASVCFLIEKTYSLKQITKKLHYTYGEVLTHKLVNSIKYYHKKFTKKPDRYLVNQLFFSFYK